MSETIYDSYTESDEDSCEKFGPNEHDDKEDVIIDESDQETESYSDHKSSPYSIDDTLPLQNGRVKKKPVKPLETDSDSDIQDSPDDVSPSADTSNINICQKNQDENTINFSPKTNRLSHHFRYNAEGILNSTAVHHSTPTPNIDMGEQTESPESSQSVQILNTDSEIIEVNSSEQSPANSPVKESKPKTSVQKTLDSFVPTGMKKRSSESKPSGCPTTIVSKAHYEAQEAKVDNLEVYFVKVQSTVDNVDLNSLPDHGQLLKERLRLAEHQYREEKLKLDNMIVSEEIKDEENKHAPVAWEDIQAGANAVLPKTFGKQAMSTYQAQRALTMDRLQQLHGALETCPQEEDKEDDPEGLKVELMPHQRRALAWLLFREKAKPSGGILADDMGLGKTLTMISLILKCMKIEKSSKDSDQFLSKHSKYNGGSLIVCPASLISQWAGEIEQRLKRGLISYNMYHGAKRETSAKRLAEYDVVITTYSIVNHENDKNSPLFGIKWRRIILDEAHQIRNPKSQTSEACCLLLAKSRWALTGTPMHNKEMDLYALLKFLRCTPFDDIQVWKRWICDKSRGGQERLHTVISSLMLRRTKKELIEKRALDFIPEKQWLLVKVELDKSELQVYHKVLIFSQTLFAQFLHQRAEKKQDFVDRAYPTNPPNQEYDKMREKLLKMNKVKSVSQHQILVLILRLRQICCHPSLITAMLDEGLDDVGPGDDQCEELNLLEQISKLNIDDDEYQPSDDTLQDVADDVKVNLKEAARGHLLSTDPIFDKERISSKVKRMLKTLKSQVLEKDDKAIIVSQWASYLNLIAIQLEKYGVEFAQLDGKVPVNKRPDIINRLNDPQSPLKVLLLSLTAGGVGLNLVGANHLFLLDLHWNPQLENQAQDRIYRVGQTKPVFVYKFMTVDTIEERIKTLQEHKLAMAEGILTGTRQVIENKLTMEDLRLIFQM